MPKNWQWKARSQVKGGKPAKHLPKYIPGKPSVIVENMPGAGHIIGANYIYNLAKPDGLSIGAFQPGIAFAQLMKVDGLNLLIAGEYPILVENYWFQLTQPKKKGAPVDWIKVKPGPITGSSFSLQKKAPHPNAAMLYLEWQFSPQGLAIFDEFIGKGVPFPGAGTRVSKWLEGVPLVMIDVNFMPK